MKKHHVSWTLVILVAGVVGLAFYHHPELRTGSGFVPPQYQAAFDLPAKETGTRAYFSQRLGVGFTYLPSQGTAVDVSESDNTIYVGDKTVEVLPIQPARDIATAIRASVMPGASEQDCYVSVLPIVADPYQAAAINYPTTDSTDMPWWDTPAAQKCPAKYRASNGVAYFLFNPSVPNKLVFVNLGQTTIGTDGTRVQDGESPHDWAESIKIFR